MPYTQEYDRVDRLVIREYGSLTDDGLRTFIYSNPQLSRVLGMAGSIPYSAPPVIPAAPSNQPLVEGWKTSSRIA